MAVTKTVTDSKLILALDTGETKNGKAVTKNASFSRIKKAASDEALFNAGTAIASLQTKDLDSTKRTDTATLTQGA